MKKSILITLGCVLMTTVQAFDKPFTIVFNQTQAVRGELYQYSERYLGTQDIVLDNATTYQLIKVTTPDNKNKQENASKPKTYMRPQTTIAQPLPLPEEALMATNTAKKAEAVAKQIYFLREIRINTLAGETTHAPADGKAMRLILDNLDKQEEALTAMFVGQTTTGTATKTVYAAIEPDSLYQEITLARFAPDKGIITDPQSEEGQPILLTIRRETRSVPDTENPNYKEKKPIYKDEVYKTVYRITCNNQTLYAKTLTL